LRRSTSRDRYPAILYGDEYFVRSGQISGENARADFTYEKYVRLNQN